MSKLRAAVLGLPIVVVILLILFAGTPFLATCGGTDEAVTAVVLACPRARELIGDDAHPARLGVACGSTETSGSSGSASWSLAYTGSRGRGTVTFEAHKRVDAWTVTGAELDFDGELVDLVACGGGGASSGSRVLAQTNADAAGAQFEGKVLRSTHDKIGAGSVCTGTLERERGSPSAHVTVKCTGGAAEATGDVLLYDGRGSFSMDVRDPSRRDDDRAEYDDAKTTDQDGTPGCRLSGSGNAGTLTLWDAGYEVVVEL